MEQKLAAIFRAVFELDDDADVSGIRQLNSPKWDSLAHVTLVGAVESEFGISIDIADSLELTSYEAMVMYLEDHAL